MIKAIAVSLFVMLAGCAATTQPNGWGYYYNHNYKEAYEQFYQGSQQGDPESFTGLGVLHDPAIRLASGVVEKDFETAEYFYLRAVELNEPTAMNNLGILYIQNGRADDGLDMINLAARWGSEAAINHLGSFKMPIPQADLKEDYESRLHDAKVVCREYAIGQHDQGLSNQAGRYAGGTGDYGTLAAVLMIQTSAAESAYNKCMTDHEFAK